MFGGIPVRVKCLRKQRKGATIVAYELMFEDGHIDVIKADILKEQIKSKKFEVVNLKLLSDGRLVDIKEDYTSRVKEIVSNMKRNNSNNLIFKRYYNYLHEQGVDLVGAFYLMYGDSEVRDNLTLSDVNIKYSKVVNGELNDASLRDLMEHPENYLGMFDNNMTDFEDCYDNDLGRRIKKGYDCDKSVIDIRLPVLILHKNGILRTVMFYECFYDFKGIDFARFSKDSTDVLVDRTEDLGGGSNRVITDNMGLRIMTMDSRGKITCYDVGKAISKREGEKMAKNILSSDIHYWVSSYTYNNVLKEAYNWASKDINNQYVLKRAGYFIKTGTLSAAVVGGMFILSPILLLGLVAFPFMIIDFD